MKFSFGVLLLAAALFSNAQSTTKLPEPVSNRVYIGTIELDPKDSASNFVLNPCESCLRYPGGLNKFRADIVRKIKSHLNFVDENFSAFIQFKVAMDGISGISIGPPKVVNNAVIKTALQGLTLGSRKSISYTLIIKNREEELFTIVEDPANFPGGLESFYQYLAKNMRYPETAARMGIEGRVFVQFIVEADGAISNVKVVKGIGAGCDLEAIRVISSMPNWEPGKQRGKHIRQKMIQPITFKFSSPNKKRKRKRKN